MLLVIRSGAFIPLPGVDMQHLPTFNLPATEGECPCQEAVRRAGRSTHLHHHHSGPSARCRQAAIQSAWVHPATAQQEIRRLQPAGPHTNRKAVGGGWQVTVHVAEVM
jgi:hypothetical protein